VQTRSSLSPQCPLAVTSIQSKLVAVGRPITGALVSLMAALVAAKVFSHSQFRVLVPLGFVAVLVVLASRFGPIVSVVGAVLSAMVFAYFLFPPLFSLRVENPAARENLLWMVLSAIALSYLLFPPRKNPLGPSR
jgi:two-component system, OmpR family, sensor histidine kinase KdpD